MDPKPNEMHQEVMGDMDPESSFNFIDYLINKLYSPPITLMVRG